MTLDPLLSRKFIFALTVVVLGFVLVILGRVQPTDWFNFAQMIGGIYVVGNIADQFVATKESNKLG